MDPPSSAAHRASVIADHILRPYRSLHNSSSSPVKLSPCLNYSPPDLSEKPPAFDVAALRQILDGHHHEARDWLFHLMEESPLFRPRRRGEVTFVAPDYNQTKEQQRAATMRRIEYLLGQGVFQGWLTGSDPEAAMRKFALFECIAVFDHSLSIELGVNYFLWVESESKRLFGDLHEDLAGQGRASPNTWPCLQFFLARAHKARACLDTAIPSYQLAWPCPKGTPVFSNRITTGGGRAL